MTETFYDVLGVDEDATQDEITEAYREMVKEYHPDVSDKPNAADKFQEAVQAEEILGDPDEREKYDEMGHETYMRRVEGSNVSGAEQSPWTTEDRRDRTHDAGFGGMGGGSDGGGATGTAGGSSAQTGFGGWHDDGGDGGAAAGGAGSNVGFGKAAGRQAGADWTTGDSTNWSDTDTAGAAADDSTYSVHDWDQKEAGPDTVTISFSQEMIIVAFALFILYPMMVMFTLNPSYPRVANLVVGLCTLFSVGYMLTIPKLAVTVFGAWSIITPIGIVMITDWGTGMSLLALGVTWIPFAYAVVVAYFTRPG